MRHEKATMVRSKVMMTQRGRILRLRMVFVSTGYGFFDFLFNPRIRFTPNRPPRPKRISIPVMGTSGSPAGSPGWASRPPVMKTKKSMKQKIRRTFISLDDHFMGY